MRKKNDWEIKSLEDIAIDIQSGSGINKNQLTESGVPVVRYSDIHGFDLFIDKCVNFSEKDLIKNKKKCEYGDILIATHSEDMENAGKSVAYLGETCFAGQNIKIIKHKQNPKYLAYALSSMFCRKQMWEKSLKSTTIYINNQIIKRIKIPLPPLEEQERIVSVLDKFHSICGNIEEGIPKLIRDVTKQYEYYRDQIFNLNSK